MLLSLRQKLFAQRAHSRYFLNTPLSVLKRITDGGLEAEPPAAGGYGGLGALHFARVYSHLKEQDFYFKANRKNLIVQSSFYLQINSKTPILHYGVQF